MFEDACEEDSSSARASDADSNCDGDGPLRPARSSPSFKNSGMSGGASSGNIRVLEVTFRGGSSGCSAEELPPPHLSRDCPPYLIGPLLLPAVPCEPPLPAAVPSATPPLSLLSQAASTRSHPQPRAPPPPFPSPLLLHRITLVRTTPPSELVPPPPQTDDSRMHDAALMARLGLAGLSSPRRPGLQLGPAIIASDMCAFRAANLAGAGGRRWNGGKGGSVRGAAEVDKQSAPAPARDLSGSGTSSSYSDGNGPAGDTPCESEAALVDFLRWYFPGEFRPSSLHSGSTAVVCAGGGLTTTNSSAVVYGSGSVYGGPGAGNVVVVFRTDTRTGATNSVPSDATSTTSTTESASTTAHPSGIQSSVGVYVRSSASSFLNSFSTATPLSPIPVISTTMAPIAAPAPALASDVLTALREMEGSFTGYASMPPSTSNRSDGGGSGGSPGLGAGGGDSGREGGTMPGRCYSYPSSLPSPFGGGEWRAITTTDGHDEGEAGVRFVAVPPRCEVDDSPDLPHPLSNHTSSSIPYRLRSEAAATSQFQSQWRLWESLWTATRPLPASAQRPLFYPETAGEMALHFLETLTPTELVCQMIEAACGSGGGVQRVIGAAAAGAAATEFPSLPSQPPQPSYSAAGATSSALPPASNLHSAVMRLSSAAAALQVRAGEFCLVAGVTSLPGLAASRSMHPPPPPPPAQAGVSPRLPPSEAAPAATTSGNLITVDSVSRSSSPVDSTAAASAHRDVAASLAAAAAAAAVTAADEAATRRWEAALAAVESRANESASLIADADRLVVVGLAGLETYALRVRAIRQLFTLPSSRTTSASSGASAASAAAAAVSDSSSDAADSACVIAASVADRTSTRCLGGSQGSVKGDHSASLPPHSTTLSSLQRQLHREASDMIDNIGEGALQWQRRMCVPYSYSSSNSINSAAGHDVSAHPSSSNSSSSSASAVGAGGERGDLLRVHAPSPHLWEHSTCLLLDSPSDRRCVLYALAALCEGSLARYSGAQSPHETQQQSHPASTLVTDGTLAPAPTHSVYSFRSTLERRVGGGSGGEVGWALPSVLVSGNIGGVGGGRNSDGNCSSSPTSPATTVGSACSSADSLAAAAPGDENAVGRALLTAGSYRPLHTMFVHTAAPTASAAAAHGTTPSAVTLRIAQCISERVS